MKKEMKKTVSLKDPRGKETREFKKKLVLSISMGIIVGLIAFLVQRSYKSALIITVISAAFLQTNFYFRKKFSASARVKKIEDVFPDFLQLMSSNLRAGITIDRAMLLSAREEFDPLDKEILKTGRDITTGKSIDQALIAMSRRINSEKVTKTISLLISGIRAGGDVATLLEESAVHMREKEFIEKKATSSVLMYVIFIFLAISLAAPALFSLSNILVGVLTNLLGSLPEVGAGVSTPFTLSGVNISTTFVLYFSLIFIFVSNILASLTIGLVSKGEEKEGLKYFIPITIISYIVFFLIKFSLSNVVKNLFI